MRHPHLFLAILAAIVGFQLLDGARIPVSAAGAPPRGLLATWKQDPSSTVTIQWIRESGEAPIPANLRYRPETGAPEHTLVVTTHVHAISLWPGIYLQRAEITGLSPDTLYRVEADGWNRHFLFRTMPAALERPVRFAIGASARPYESDSGLDATLEQIRGSDPDFMVWAGHLAHAKARMRDVAGRERRWDAWFEAVSQHLILDSGQIIPIIVSIGETEVMERFVFNHPYYSQDDDYRLYMAPYFYQLFPFPGQPGYQALDFGEYLTLILLDSNHSNPVAGRQTKWLEDALSRRGQVPYLFPVYHVAGYPGGMSPLEVSDESRPWMDGYDGFTEAQVRRYWSPVFENHRIRVAFEHYNHVYKRTVPIRRGTRHPAGVVYLGDGNLGEATGPTRSPGETWYLEKVESTRHFILVTLDDQEATFQAIANDGRLIDEYRSRPRCPELRKP